MKLTAAFLLMGFLHVSAHSFSQKVSFSGKDVPLQTVFASLERQTGLAFFYNYALLKDTRPISLEIRDLPFEDALNQVLTDEGLSFYQEGKTIFIVRKPAATTAQTPQPAADLLIVARGRVLNQAGEALVSATVTVKNGNKGTVTDEKGEFELKNVPAGATLEISYGGYERRYVEATDQMVTIQLSITNDKLDEAQVIAYGQTTQRETVGNIGMVKGEDIQKQPVSNPLLALEGRVPGLFITQTSGMPGSGVTVRVQGQNSIGNGNDPLYVIDGVPYVSQLLTTTIGTQLGTSGGNANGNPMNYINPADIESVEILKDADATAIYGSRAANGALLITTKKGKAGKTKVNIDFQDGWGGLTRKMPLLNTQQYLAMRREALANDGLAGPSPYDFDINGSYDTTRYTDWQKVLLGGTARYTNVNGSISGGNLSTQYMVSGTFRRETTVFPGNHSDAKGSVHFSLNTVSTNQRIKLQITGSYLIDNNQIPSGDITGTALSLPPNAPALYNPDGTLNWAIVPGVGYTFQNPMANLLYNPYQNKTYNLVSNGVFSYDVFRGMQVRVNMGYNNMQANEISQVLSGITDPISLAAIGPNVRSATYSNNMIRTAIIEPQIDYKTIIGKGKIEGLLGSTILETNTNGTSLFGQGFNSDVQVQDMHSAATLTVNSSVASQYKYNAIFGKINYTWSDKYLLDLIARRDGSSRFGPANEFHNFGSVGAAWIFSQEGFFRQFTKAINYGKIRASFGTTGNDQIGDYTYLNLYTTVKPPVPYQGITGLTITNLPNPYLQWENTRKLQLGLEFGLLQSRIVLTANYVQNRSSNQLLAGSIPIITGFNSIALNLPVTVANTLGEFSLNTINVKSKNFMWNSSLNFTSPRNKIFPYHGSIPTATFLKSLGYLPVFHSVGVDPASGAYEFLDSHGKPTFNPSIGIDQVATVNANLPICYGAFANTFQFKRFELDFLFQYVRHIQQNYFGLVQPGGAYANQAVWVLRRWQKQGDVSPIQRYNSDYSLLQEWVDEKVSTNGYSIDGSYIRLKNFSFSYSLDEKIIHLAHADALRIFIQGQNLLTFTKFKGLDPETGNSLLPPLKMLTVGLHLELQ